MVPKEGTTTERNRSLGINRYTRGVAPEATGARVLRVECDGGIGVGRRQGTSRL